jgi:hypothetical protein
MKAFLIIILLGLCSGLMAQNTAKPASVWLFASFKDPGDGGIWLAISIDGLKFTPVNNDQPLRLSAGVSKTISTFYGPVALGESGMPHHQI